MTTSDETGKPSEREVFRRFAAGEPISKQITRRDLVALAARLRSENQRLAKRIANMRCQYRRVIDAIRKATERHGASNRADHGP